MLASAEPVSRPIALLFTGRPHGSFDGSRAAVVKQLRSMGAECVEGFDARVTCAVCAGGCRRVFESFNLPTHEDPSLFGAKRVVALAARSIFCVEPTSDTLVRSHFYAAVLGGCVPVLLDTELPFHPSK